MIESPLIKYTPKGYCFTPSFLLYILYSLYDRIIFIAWSKPFNFPIKTLPSVVITFTDF